VSHHFCDEKSSTHSHLSHLAGFSSFPEYHGTREGSSSFFEVALVRPTDHVPQTYAVVEKETPLYYNLHAVRHYTSYTESLIATRLLNIRCGVSLDTYRPVKFYEG
jgi:hypothetical protein